MSCKCIITVIYVDIDAFISEGVKDSNKHIMVICVILRIYTIKKWWMQILQKYYVLANWTLNGFIF